MEGLLIGSSPLDPLVLNSLMSKAVPDSNWTLISNNRESPIEEILHSKEFMGSVILPQGSCRRTGTVELPIYPCLCMSV